MKTNEKLVSCASQMTRSGGLNTDKLPKHTSSVYSPFLFIVEERIPRHCGRDISELVLFISELKDGNCRSANMTEMGIRRERGTVVVPSIPLL